MSFSLPAGVKVISSSIIGQFDSDDEKEIAVITVDDNCFIYDLDGSLVKKLNSGYDFTKNKSSGRDFNGDENPEIFNLINRSHLWLYQIAAGQNELSAVEWGEYKHLPGIKLYDETAYEDKFFSPDGDENKDSTDLGYFRTYKENDDNSILYTYLRIFDKDNLLVKNIPLKITDEPGSGNAAKVEWRGYADEDYKNGDYTNVPVVEGAYRYVYHVESKDKLEMKEITGEIYLDITKPDISCNISNPLFLNESKAGYPDSTDITISISDNSPKMTSLKIEIMDRDIKTVYRTFLVTGTNLDLKYDEEEMKWKKNVSITWNGKDQNGIYVNNDIYQIKISAIDIAGNITNISPEDNIVFIGMTGTTINSKSVVCLPFVITPDEPTKNETTLHFHIKNELMKYDSEILDALPEDVFKVDLQVQVYGKHLKYIEATEEWIEETVDFDIVNISNFNIRQESVTIGNLTFQDDSTFDIIWNGKDLTNKTVYPDDYTLRIYIEDTFGNEDKANGYCIVATTLPEITSIKSEGNGYYRIYGRANRLKGFSGYEMWYRKDGESEWKPLKVPEERQSKADSLYPDSNKSIRPVTGENGTLALWDTFGLDNGDYEIKLHIIGEDEDTDCIKNWTINNGVLIRDIELSSDVITPNGDGIKDSAIFSFKVSQEIHNVKIIVKDKDKNIVGEISLGTVSGSEYPYEKNYEFTGSVNGDELNGEYYLSLISDEVTPSEELPIMIAHNTSGGAGSVVEINSLPVDVNGSVYGKQGYLYSWWARGNGKQRPRMQVEWDLKVFGKQDIIQYPKIPIDITGVERYTKFDFTDSTVEYALKAKFDGCWPESDFYDTDVRNFSVSEVINIYKEAEINISYSKEYKDDDFGESGICDRDFIEDKWSLERIDFKKNGYNYNELINFNYSLGYKIIFNFDNCTYEGEKLWYCSDYCNCEKAPTPDRDIPIKYGDWADNCPNWVCPVICEKNEKEKDKIVLFFHPITLKDEIFATSTDDIHSDGYDAIYQTSQQKFVYLSKKDGTYRLYFDKFRLYFDNEYKHILSDTDRVLEYEIKHLNFSFPRYFKGESEKRNTENYITIVNDVAIESGTDERYMELSVNAVYTDAVPWPLKNEVEFYTVAPNGVYSEMSWLQDNEIAITSVAQKGNPFNIPSILNLNNGGETLIISDDVYDIDAFISMQNVKMLDSDGTVMADSDEMPELKQFVLFDVAPSSDNKDAAINISCIKELDWETDGQITGGIGFISMDDTINVDSINSVGHYESQSTQGYNVPGDVDFSLWDVQLQNLNKDENQYVEIENVDNSSHNITIKRTGTGENVKEILKITGTVNVEGFEYYTLDIGRKNFSGEGYLWWKKQKISNFGDKYKGKTLINNGTIAYIDITDLIDGNYTLLLTVKGNEVVERKIDFKKEIPIQMTNVVFSTDSFDPEQTDIVMQFDLSEDSIKDELCEGVVISISNLSIEDLKFKINYDGKMGKNIVSWDGKDDEGNYMVPGNYTIRITANNYGGGTPAVYEKVVGIVDDSVEISDFYVTPDEIVVSGSIGKNKAGIFYNLSEKLNEDEDCKIKIIDGTENIIRTLNGTGDRGTNFIIWNGYKDEDIEIAGAGVYKIKIEVKDNDGIIDEKIINNAITVLNYNPGDLLSLIDINEADGEDGKTNNVIPGKNGTYFNWKTKASGWKAPKEEFTANVVAEGKEYWDINFNWTASANAIDTWVSYEPHIVYPVDTFYADHNHQIIIQKLFGLGQSYINVIEGHSYLVYQTCIWDTTADVKVYGLCTVIGMIVSPIEYVTYYETVYPDRTISGSASGSAQLVYENGLWRLKNSAGQDIDKINISWSWSPSPNGTVSAVSFKNVKITVTTSDYPTSGEENTYTPNFPDKGLLSATILDSSSFSVSRYNNEYPQDWTSPALTWHKSATAFDEPVTEILLFSKTNDVYNDDDEKPAIFGRNHIGQEIYPEKFFVSDNNNPDVTVRFKTGQDQVFVTGRDDPILDELKVEAISENYEDWASVDEPILADTSGHFTGNLIMPFFEGSDNISAVDIFKHNNNNDGAYYNPEGINKDCEIRISSVDIDLFKKKRGKEVLISSIKDKYAFKNDNEIQILNGNDEILQEGEELSYTNIPQNNRFESFKVIINKELERKFLIVKGTATSGDTFSEYSLEWGKGGNPTIWNLIKSSSDAVTNNELGKWDITGLSGIYSLLLTVKDDSFNVAQAKRTFQIGNYIDGSDMFFVKSPYGKAMMALSRNALINGDEVYIKQSEESFIAVDEIVYGKYEELDLPEEEFVGNTYTDQEISDVGAISLERIKLGNEAGISIANRENIKQTFQLNIIPTPGWSDNPKEIDSTHILINEIYLGNEIFPLSEEDDEKSEKYSEFIELYNPISSSVDLSGYIIGDGEGEGKIPDGIIISATNFLIIARDADAFFEKFEFYPDLEWDPYQYDNENNQQVPDLILFNNEKPVISMELDNKGSEVISLIPKLPDEYIDKPGGEFIQGDYVFDFKPDGLRFDWDIPPTLIYKGNTNELPSDVDVNTLRLAYINDKDEVEFLDTSYVNIDKHGNFTINAEVYHFSEYALVGGVLNPAAPVLDKLPEYATDLRIDINGTAEDNTVVKLYRNYSLVGSEGQYTETNSSFCFKDILLDEGDNIFSAKAVNYLGKESKYSEKVKIIYDKTKPEILSKYIDEPVFSPDNNGIKDKCNIEFTFSEPVNYIFSIQDNTAKEVYYAVSEEWTDSVKFNIDSDIINKEGEYFTFIQAYDKANNYLNPLGLKIVSDLTQPGILLVFQSKTNVSFTKDNISDLVEFKFKLNDNNSEELYSDIKITDANNNDIFILTNGFINKNEELSLIWDGKNIYGNAVPEGEYKISAALQDEAGNVSVFTMGAVIVDNTPPEGLNLVELNKIYFNNNEALKYSYDIKEDCFVSVTINNENEINNIIHNFYTLKGVYTNSFVTALEDGNYLLNFQIKDKTGNLKNVSKMFIIDSKIPLVNINENILGNYTNIIKIYGSVNDLNINKISIDYRKMNEDVTDYHNLNIFQGKNFFNELIYSYDTSFWKGLYFIRIFAEDKAYNSTQKEFGPYFFEDSTPLLYLPNLVYNISESININFYLYDTANIGIKYYNEENDLLLEIPEQLFQSGLTNFYFNIDESPLNLIEEGSIKIEITAQTTNGTIEEQKSEMKNLIVNIDRKKPVVEIQKPEDFAKVNSDFDITGTVHDENLKKYIVSLISLKNGIIGDLFIGNENIISNTIASIYLKDYIGEYILRVKAEDTFGNLEEKEINIFIDDSSPVLKIISPDYLTYINNNFNMNIFIQDPFKNTYKIFIKTEAGEWNKILSFTNKEIYNNVFIPENQFLIDGLYKLKVEREDKNINTETAYIIDRVLPEISFEYIDTNENFQFNYSANDDNLDYYSIINVENNQEIISGNANTETAKIFKINKQDFNGMQTFRLTAYDKANNLNSKDLIIDFSDPEVKIVLPVPESKHNNLLPVKFNVSGNIYNLNFKILIENIIFQSNLSKGDIDSSTYSNSFNLSNLDEEIYNLQVLIYNNENLITHDKIQIEVDRTVLISDIVLNPPYGQDNLSEDQGMMFEYKSYERLYLNTYIYRKTDNQNIISFKDNKFLPVDSYKEVWDLRDRNGVKVDEDVYVFKIEAADEAGNQTNLIKEFFIGERNNMPDYSSPQTTLTHNSEPYYNNPVKNELVIVPGSSIYLNAEDIQTGDDLYASGVEYTYFNTNDVDFQIYAIPIILPENIYTFKFYSIDYAYNKEDTHNVSLIIDGSPPQCQINAPVHLECIKSNYGIRGTVKDASLSQYTLEYGDGVSPLTWNVIYQTDITDDILPLISNEIIEYLDTTQLADGVYSIRLTAEDKLENKSESKIIVTIDNTVPECEITSPVDYFNATANNTITLQGTAKDLNFKSYSIYIGSGEKPSEWVLANNYYVSVDNDILADVNLKDWWGIISIKLVVEDKAGNIEEDMVKVKRIPSVWINEVNPQGLSEDEGDWAEIYCFKNMVVDLKDFILTDLDGIDTKFADSKVSIHSNQYVVVHWEDGVDETDDVSDLNGNGYIDLYVSDTELTKTDDQLVLKINDLVVDAVIWSDYDGGMPSSEVSDANLLVNIGEWIGEYSISNQKYSVRLGTNKKGAIGRIPYKDNNIKDDWIFFEIGSPGKANDITPPITICDYTNSGEWVNYDVLIKLTAEDPLVDGFASGVDYTRFMIVNYNEPPDLTSDIYNLTSIVKGQGLVLPPITEEGIHRVCFWSLDKVGNKEYASTNYSSVISNFLVIARDSSPEAISNYITTNVVWVMIDKTMPMIDITGVENNQAYTQNRTVDISISDRHLDRIGVEVLRFQGIMGVKQGEGKIVYNVDWTNDNLLKIKDLRLKITNDGVYEIKVSASDLAGNITLHGIEFVIDRSAPDTPQGLSGYVEYATNIALFWNEVTNNDLAGYNVYRNRELIQDLKFKIQNYYDTGLTNGLYEYHISSVDWLGNESGLSEALILTVDKSVVILLPKSGVYYRKIAKIKAKINTDVKKSKLIIEYGQGTNPIEWKTIKGFKRWSKYIHTLWYPWVLKEKINGKWKYLNGEFRLRVRLINENGTRQDSRIVWIDNEAPKTRIAEVVKVTNKKKCYDHKVINFLQGNELKVIAHDPVVETPQSPDGIYSVASGIDYTYVKIYKYGEGIIVKEKNYEQRTNKYELTDGFYKIYYYSEDNAKWHILWQGKRGNREKKHKDYVLVDTESPVVSIETPVSGQVVSGEVLIKGQITDICLSGYEIYYTNEYYGKVVLREFRIQNPEFRIKKYKSIDFELIGDTAGLYDTDYKIVVRATDFCGNSQHSEVDVILTEGGGPAPNRSPDVPENLLVDGKINPVINHLTPMISWQFKDPDDGDYQTAFRIQGLEGSSEIIFDTGKMNSTNNFYIIDLSEENYELQTINYKLIVWDKGDLASYWTDGEDYFVIDINITNPDMESPVIVLEGVPSITNESVVLQYTVTDNRTAHENIIIHGDNSPYETEGEHHVTLKAIDEAGNFSLTNIQFIIDMTTPEIIITGVQEDQYYKNNVSVTVEIIDENLRESNIVIRHNENIIHSSSSSQFSTELSDEGNYRIEAEGEDKAGNIANRVLEFGIDTTAPIVNIEGVEEGGEYTEVNPNIIAIDTNLSKVDIFLNENVILSSNTKLPTMNYELQTIKEDGDYKLKAKAEDKASNIAEKEVNFHIIPANLSNAVMFYVNYNENTADAAMSRGNGACIRGGALTRQGEGFKRIYKALDSSKCKDSTRGAEHSSTSNINLSRGSVLMWVKTKWKCANNKGRCFFAVRKPDDSGNENDYVMKYGVVKNKGTVVYIRDDEGYVEQYKADDGAESTRWYKEEGWHYIGYSWDCSRGIVNFYIDGEIIKSYTNTGWSKAESGNMWIGNLKYKSCKYAKSRIDEFVIYSRTLTAEEVKDQYDEQRTLYVDANYNGEEEGTKEKPYNTINEALSKSDHRMIIKVKAGEYIEKLYIKKSITIEGEEGAVITYNKCSDYLIKASSCAEKVRISGLKIDGNNKINYVVKIENENCTISNCHVMSGKKKNIYIGGWKTEGKIRLIRNVIEKCKEKGIYVGNKSEVEIINNTIVKNGLNQGSSYSLGIYINHKGSRKVLIMNNIIYDNGKYGIKKIKGNIEIKFNDVYNHQYDYYNCNAGEGDISVNPEFEDETDGDYHLKDTSPCIDAGNPDMQYNDPDGSRNDIGCYYVK